MMCRRRAVIVGIIFLLVVAGVTSAAAANWQSRPGTIEHALAQPDGTFVSLDAVCTDKMKARQDPPYFVVSENADFQSRIIVYAKPPVALRAGHTVDVEGELATLPNGERMIATPRISVYLDQNGRMLKHMPMKGRLAPAPWSSKVELTAPVETLTMAATTMSAPAELPVVEPQEPALYYSSVSALLAAITPSEADGRGVGLQCLSVTAVGVDPSYGSYAIIKSDDGPQTVKLYYTAGVSPDNRINQVSGQIRSAAGELAICVDAGPDYDPQGFLGAILRAAPGSITYARTLADGLPVTVENVTVVAGTGDLSDGLSVQDEMKSAGMRVVHSGSKTIGRGDVVTVTGVISTSANGERRITADDDGILVISTAGSVPGYVGLNNRMLGGGAVNFRTAGVNVPSQEAGLPNLGMLVRTWGRVTYVDIPAKTMYVDDGSNLNNGDGLPTGLRVIWDAEGGTVSAPGEGDFLSHVIGISGMEERGLNQRARVLKIRKMRAPAVAVDSLSSAVDLAWIPQDNTSYRIYRAEDPNGPFALVDEVEAGTYHDTNVVSGTTYFYRLNAVVSGIEGGPSHLVSATPGSSLVFPSVQLTGFDGATFEYSYTVTAPANMSYSFGWLQIDALVPDGASTGPWSMAGPFVNGVNAAWQSNSAVYDTASGNSSARWDAISRGQIVNPGSPWVGVFKLIAPNTQPVPGFAATKDAVAASWHVSDTLVPGALPPPPTDSIAPTTTITLNGEQRSGWFRADVTVTLTAEDDSSGVAFTEYQVGGGEDWSTYTSAFVLGQDGLHTVFARSVDTANNQEEPPVQSDVRIDKTPPFTMIGLSGSQHNGWYTSAVAITISSSDAGSGVESTEYSINGGQWVPYEGQITLAQDGAYHIAARSVDVAGNPEAQPVDLFLVIDTTAPISEISATGAEVDGWFTREALVSIAASDLASGVAGVEYQVNGGDWTTYQEPFILAQNGVSIVSARSMDTAGNVENPPVQREIRIDSSAPVTTISLSGDQTNGWYTGDVTVALSAVDDEDAALTTEYRLGDEPWAEYASEFILNEDGVRTLFARSTDGAGNVEDPAVYQEIKVDTKLPLLTVIDMPSAGCYLVKRDALDVVFTATDLGSGMDGLPTARLSFTPNDPLQASASVTDLPVIPVEGQENTYKIHTLPQTPGTYVLTLTATDKAGHSASFNSGLSYTVGAYEVEWLPPIALMDTFVMQDGSTLPVKFRLKDPCNNNAYVNTADYRITVTKDDNDADPTNDVVYAANLVPSLGTDDSYHVNVSTKTPTLWPVGLYTVTITGPGIWDIYSGPYKSKYGVDIQDGALAKGVGRKS